MKIQKKLREKYNQPDTLVVISSFPHQGEEIASRNAVARYTQLLVSHFSTNRKIVIVCEEKNKKDQAYEYLDNVLVVPSYKPNSLLMFQQIQKAIFSFNRSKSIHLQFEFSIFGEKKVLFPLALYLASLRLRDKYVTIMLHQVSLDLNELSKHLGLKKGSLKVMIYNKLLDLFYRLINTGTDRIFVHDYLLAKRLAQVVDIEKIKVIPHGSDNPIQLSQAKRLKGRKKYGFKQKDFVILMYGYQSAYKGTDWITKAVGEFAAVNPQHSIKLFIAGGKSPTLKALDSYQTFSRKLNRLINKYSKVVVAPGFIPEKDVPLVFAASDVVVFPYRAHMSASGALSVTWQYAKPFLASNNFLSILADDEIAKTMDDFQVHQTDICFSLNKASFNNVLASYFAAGELSQNLSAVGRQIAEMRSWNNVALAYEQAVMSPKISDVAVLTLAN